MMWALFTALNNIAQRTGRFTVAQATDIYNGLWRIISFALFACVAAFVMNAWRGWTTPSLVLAIAFAIAAVYVWAKPLHILVVAGLGGLARRIAADATLRCAVENALTAYLGFLKWVLLSGVTFLFITGTVSFRENPQAILPVLVGLGVVGLFTWTWPTLFVGAWGRKLVYWYAVAIIALSFGSLIPGSAWMKYVGWDPATVKPTATADGLYRLDRAVRELDDQLQAEKLEPLRDKLRRHEALTTEDKKIVAEVRQSMASSSAPAARVAGTEWRRLDLSPGEESSVGVPPVGRRLAFDGAEGIVLRTVYADGSACITPRETCPKKPMADSVFVNEAATPGKVAYTFK